MKILWIPHLPWARMQGQREWHLIRRLLPQGHEIHIVTWEAIEGTRAMLRSVRAEIRRDGELVIHRAPRLPNPLGRLTGDYRRGFPPNEWLFRRYVRGLLARRSFDVLLFGPSHKAVGLPPFDARVPRIFDYLDLCAYPEIENAYLGGSDAVLCTSTVLVDRVRELGGRPVYLPNGVDVARLQSADGQAMRERLGLRGKRVVSLIGLTYSRSLFFVDAIAEAARAVPDIAFLAVGAGGWLPHESLGPMAARCRALGIPFVATGAVPHDEIAPYFKVTDVGLYPGDANPYFDAACPIKVLEYRAAGRNVVATDLEELRRLALPGVHLAPPEPGAFARALVRALREPAPPCDLAAFDWNVLATRFTDMCAGLVEDRVRAGARLAPVSEAAS